jgi:hypothetical protein
MQDRTHRLRGIRDQTHHLQETQERMRMYHPRGTAIMRSQQEQEHIYLGHLKCLTWELKQRLRKSRQQEQACSDVPPR